MAKTDDIQSPLNFADKFDDVRAKYYAKTSQASSPVTPPLSNGSMYQAQDMSALLQQRYAGFDKLFMTLVNGIVEDPDYAVAKDPKIYQRMLRDPQIYYCLMVRKAATSSLPWHVVPQDSMSSDQKAKEIADAAYKRIVNIPQFRNLLDNVLDAFLPGMSVNELIWKVDDNGQYVVSHHFPVNKDRFRYRKDGVLTLLQPSAPTYGKPVPPHKFIAHHFNVVDGSWNDPYNSGYTMYGRGLADTPLYHYFYFKVTALRFMLKNLERNANPFKIYYTGPMNAKLAAKLDSVLAALQNDSVVGIPGTKGETNVDVEPARGGQDNYTGVIEYIDRLITRAILGQELMTEMPAVGSYAAAQVHATVFAKITENDREQLEDTLNATLMRFDSMLNLPSVPQELRPVFKFKNSALIDAGQFLQNAAAAMNLGLTLSENQIRESSGFRLPTPGEPVLDKMQQEMQAQEMQLQMGGMTGQDTTKGNAKKPTPSRPKSPGGANKNNNNAAATAAAVASRTAKKQAKKSPRK